MSKQADKQPASSKQLSYWIKKRINVGFGRSYVACGQLTVRDALRHEHNTHNTHNGTNIMLCYSTQAEYEAALTAFKARGERVLA